MGFRSPCRKVLVSSLQAQSTSFMGITLTPTNRLGAWETNAAAQSL